MEQTYFVIVNELTEVYCCNYTNKYFSSDNLANVVLYKHELNAKKAISSSAFWKKAVGNINNLKIKKCRITIEE